jgi:hypothetical protein
MLGLPDGEEPDGVDAAGQVITAPVRQRSA